MHSIALFAVGAALLSVGAAVPLADTPHHRHSHLHKNKRDYIWVEETEVIIETVALTKTVWVQPGESTPESKPPVYAPASPPALPTPPVDTPASYNPPDYSSATHESPPPANPPAFNPSPPASGPPEADPPASNPPPSSPAPPAYLPESEPSVPPPTPAPPAYIPESQPSVPPPAPAPPAYIPESKPPVPPPAPATPAPAYVPPPSEEVAPAPAPIPTSPSVKSSGSGLSGMAAPGQSYTGDLTWYDVGLGACGNTNTKDEAVVAIPESIFDAYNNGNPNLNPLCGGTVTITGKDGQKHTAKIVDRCPGCKQADLDLSQDFFNKVTNNGDGRVGGMEWCFD